MNSDTIKELLTVFDTTRQQIDTLARMLESSERKDSHKIANQMFMIDLKITEIRKRMNDIRTAFT